MEAKDMEVCKLTRADGSLSYHGNIQAFLRRLDRQDLNDLYSLVQERFQDHPLEGHDLLLWGDLRMIFDPDENDELSMNQPDWKLLRWKLLENYEVHTLFMDGIRMEINMLVEKKYPLIKELLEKMLNLQLEAKEESTMASYYEDIRPIFERVWDQIHAFIPMDSEIEKEVIRNLDLIFDKSNLLKKLVKRRMTAVANQLEEVEIKYKVNYEPLSRKFPIVSWEYQLREKMEAKDMELLRWKLLENYEVHTLFMDGVRMEINMLVEKKYPLIKELLEKMLNLQLEAKEESTMAVELIKFIKSLLEV
nr:hypothetical protein [Tanacetum cinerariifolium]